MRLSQENEHSPWAKDFAPSPQARPSSFSTCIMSDCPTVTVQGYGFPSEYHLKDRRDFSRLAQRGRLFSDGHIAIQWARSGVEHARLGLTVGRRAGSSVERNTFRRRAKEAFRCSKLRNIPGVDINLKPKNTLSVSYSEFCMLFEKFEKYLSQALAQ